MVCDKSAVLAVKKFLTFCLRQVRHFLVLMFSSNYGEIEFIWCQEQEAPAAILKSYRPRNSLVQKRRKVSVNLPSVLTEVIKLCGRVRLKQSLNSALWWIVVIVVLPFLSTGELAGKTHTPFRLSTFCYCYRVRYSAWNNITSDIFPSSNIPVLCIYGLLVFYTVVALARFISSTTRTEYIQKIDKLLGC